MIAGPHSHIDYLPQVQYINNRGSQEALTVGSALAIWQMQVVLTNRKPRSQHNVQEIEFLEKDRSINVISASTVIFMSFIDRQSKRGFTDGIH